MLKTTELTFNVAGNVGNYYKENNIDIKYNSVNTIPIQKVNPNSHLMVDAICDICGKETKVQYRRYNKSVKNGGYYSCSSKCGKNKTIETNIIKYGSNSYFESDEFKDKSKKTFLTKWGADHFRRSDQWKIKNSLLEVEKRKKTIFDTFLGENPKIIGQDDDNFTINCEIHGRSTIPKSIFANRKIIGTEFCTICKPIESNISGKEVLLKKLISEIYDGKIIAGYKIERKEIDIFLPDINIGFEFNGLRWHSELFKEKEYHINKTNLCKSHGIRLIHIFEDDFDFKLDIVKSIISNVVGKSEIIFARKTTIKKINEKGVVKRFLNENHLQGFVNTNINYGLYYNDELVSLMTFSKLRKIFKNKESENNYEMVRFCNKIGVGVIGGASKLFKYFLTEYIPKNVVSYCDISWATGNLYKRLGFNSLGITPPNYYYVVNRNRENRIKYQKHKLAKLGYDENMTESKIMNNRGYFRIYNCGNEKYVYKNTN